MGLESRKALWETALVLTLFSGVSWDTEGDFRSGQSMVLFVPPSNQAHPWWCTMVTPQHLQDAFCPVTAELDQAP